MRIKFLRETGTATGSIDLLQRHGRRLRVECGPCTHVVGRSASPALEAIDVIALLQGYVDAPSDLGERALP